MRRGPSAAPALRTATLVPQLVGPLFGIRSAVVDARTGGHGERAMSAEAGTAARREPPPPPPPWDGAGAAMNPWQRAAVAALSAVGAAADPSRADLVAAVGETTGTPAFRRILARMRRDPEGQRILLDRPTVTSTSMTHIWDLPPTTFGGEYAKFMGDRNFSPDDRPPVQYLDSEDLAYVALRSRQVHDFWHVLFNLPTSILGELALKMVEFHQTGIPMCFLSVAGASWRLKLQQRNYLFTHYAPWALRAGLSASDLMCIYYEDHMHEELDELRQRWGILPAPALPKSQSL